VLQEHAVEHGENDLLRRPQGSRCYLTVLEWILEHR
jgi:hypothetical protein